LESGHEYGVSFFGLDAGVWRTGCPFLTGSVLSTMFLILYTAWAKWVLGALGVQHVGTVRVRWAHSSFGTYLRLGLYLSIFLPFYLLLVILISIVSAL
jgi:hypothetical protein